MSNVWTLDVTSGVATPDTQHQLVPCGPLDADIYPFELQWTPGSDAVRFTRRHTTDRGTVAATVRVADATESQQAMPDATTSGIMLRPVR